MGIPLLKSWGVHFLSLIHTTHKLRSQKYARYLEEKQYTSGNGLHLELDLGIQSHDLPSRVSVPFQVGFSGQAQAHRGTEQLSKTKHTEAAFLAFRVFCLPSGCCSEKMQVYCSFLLPLPDPNICLADLMVSKLVLSSYFSSDDSLPSCPATGEKLADEICMAQCAKVSKTANFSSEFTPAQTGFKI